RPADVGHRRRGALPRRAESLRRRRQHHGHERGRQSHVHDPGRRALHRRRDDPEARVTAQSSLDARRDVLALVLDTLIPAEEGFPAAGGIALEHVLAAARESQELDALLSDGLRALEDAARAAGGIVSLDAGRREALLQQIERGRPDLFAVLLRQTYDGYYAHPAVVARLGLDPGPVHPRGHRIESEVLPELSRVAGRGRLYRPA